jgi:hypothetical protein
MIQALDGTMVGDVGFDPLGLSSVADIRFLAEAELKHCRLAMLAAAGAMFQDIATDPTFSGIAGGAKMTALHDKLVSTGSMGQVRSVSDPSVRQCEIMYRNSRRT